MELVWVIVIVLFVYNRWKITGIYITAEPTQTNRSKTPVSTIIPLISILVTGCMAYGYLSHDWKVNHDFQQTACEVSGSSLDKITKIRGWVAYRAMFHLNYSVDGKFYHAYTTRSVNREFIELRSVAINQFNRFQVWQTYPCWYDPNEPRVVVLERGYLYSGLFFAGLTLWLLVCLFRDWSKVSFRYDY